MKKISTLLFFIAVTLTGFLWVILIPLWHTPDEQAHFGQVAYIAERGKIQRAKDLFDSTEEIYISEKLLGTARDKFGNNKFTFHPEYQIEYSETSIGKHEPFIESLSQTDAKTKFVHSESSNYPVLYYIPATWIYRLFYDQNIFIRVFAVRLWSLLLYALTVYFVYKIGKLIFQKDRLSYLTLTILVAFQPMFIFSNIGVTSDSLGNFLFTAFLYLSAKIILKFKKSDFVLLSILVILSVYTKPQFIIMLPLLMLLFLIIFIKNKKKKNKRLFITGILGGFGLMLLLMNFLQWPITMINQFVKNLDIPSLVRYSLEYTIPHSWKEVLPWYWGVYDWLGVTYPRFVHRIINRIIIVALIGLFVAFMNLIRKKLWKQPITQVILFQSIAFLFYFTAISFFDYSSWHTSTYSLGVQGRYFFPLISIQMALLLIGIRSILPRALNLKTLGTKILALAMVCLNMYAFYFVASTYYNVSSFENFIVQASQYKPWFVKNGYFTICLILYAIILVVGVIYPIVRVHNQKNLKLSS